MKKILKTVLLVAVIAFTAQRTFAQISIGIGISVRIAPPALPVYVQPACPTDGYLWEPGYWGYDDADGYYWVPGVWIAPPQTGVLWTPGYWGYDGGNYAFHAGYWGPHIGFYGGVNYGGGYGGVGFIGGGWQGGSFRYNTAVVNVNTTVVHNTYVDRTVINNTTVINNRASFNGPGGITRQPQPQERQAMNEQHIQPTGEQMSHAQLASKDRSQFASVNNGHPAAAAMNKVGGRPLDEQGHTSTTSTLGRNSNPANRPGGNNGAQPANKNMNRPADNAVQPANAQPKPQTQPAQQQHQQAQPQQQHAQQQHPQQQQHAQPQHAQPRPAPRPRPQAPPHEEHHP